MSDADNGSAIVLARLQEADAAAIRNWPPYPPEVRDLDYALRQGGWLDTFPESEKTYRFGAWHGKALVGFSLLTDIADGSAEFYVAIQPQLLGKGYGRALTRATVREGCQRLGLRRIYLKVRDWHHAAAALYQSVGFKQTGTTLQKIQGQPVRFVTMEIQCAGASAK